MLNENMANVYASLQSHVVFVDPSGSKVLTGAPHVVWYCSAFDGGVGGGSTQLGGVPIKPGGHVGVAVGVAVGPGVGVAVPAGVGVGAGGAGGPAVGVGVPTGVPGVDPEKAVPVAESPAPST